MADSINKNTTDNGNIPASQVTAVLPPRAIAIRKGADQELKSEAFKLVCRNATATVLIESFDCEVTEAFRKRHISFSSHGAGLLSVRTDDQQYNICKMLRAALEGSGAVVANINEYEWFFEISPVGLTLDGENLKTGLTPELIARLLKRTVRVVVRSNDSPVFARFKVDKYGKQTGLALLSFDCELILPFPEYLPSEPVDLFNAVADFCDAAGKAPKVDRRYYYAAA